MTFMTTARTLAALACLALAAPAAAQQGGHYAMTAMDNSPAGKMEYMQEWGPYSVFVYDARRVTVYIENRSAPGGGSLPTLDGYYVTTPDVAPACPSGPAATHTGARAPSWGRLQIQTSPDRSSIFLRIGACDGQPSEELAGAWRN